MLLSAAETFVLDDTAATEADIRRPFPARFAVDPVQLGAAPDTRSARCGYLLFLESVPEVGCALA